MNAFRSFGFLALGLATLVGCTKTPDAKQEAPKAVSGQPKANQVTSEEEAKIQAALAKLPDTDRALALAQKFCPIQKSRLGSMGTPDRIELQGQPVFLCCSGCADDARAEPKKTLEQVAKFKTQP